MNWVSIDSDNGLWPVQRQAIIWTNAGLLSIGPIGINFNEIWIKIENFSLMKTHLKMSPSKWWPFCKGADELTFSCIIMEGGMWCQYKPWYHCERYVGLMFGHRYDLLSEVSGCSKKVGISDMGKNNPLRLTIDFLRLYPDLPEAKKTYWIYKIF